MGIATGTATRENYRELYFPPHERAMAHYSYPSPHRNWALVVQMDENGDCGACELISLNGSAPPRTIGPAGACRSAGWSPDGAWMYLSAFVNGKSHLGRQRFPNGQPEQITFGPTEEEGVAVVPDGRSIITSVGVHQSGHRAGRAAGVLPLAGQLRGSDSPGLHRRSEERDIPGTHGACRAGRDDHSLGNSVRPDHARAAAR
jgi:hypothetical protein